MTSTTTPISRRSRACGSRPRSRPTPRSSPRSCRGGSREQVELEEAFRSTVASFEGSVAIGAQAGAEPGKLLLALRGSGQALYVGLRRRLLRRSRASPTASSKSASVTCASTARRCSSRETRRRRARSCSSTARTAGDARRHQPLVVRRPGRSRCPKPSCSDPRSRPVTSARRCRALPAQGDVGGARRRSARRCAVASSSATGRLDVRLPPETLSAAVIERLRNGHRSGACSRSGRAARHVAGRSLARRAARRDRAAELDTGDRGGHRDRAFGLRARGDMSDTLVVAISQSGTTTDTNRTVDLARSRGAVVDRDREPAPERSRRQERRRALHVRRSRRRDERGVDQGVLRAARGGLSARVRPRHRARGRCRRRSGVPPRAARRAARSARRDERGVRTPARDRGRRATTRVAPALRGRSSATA